MRQKLPQRELSNKPLTAVQVDTSVLPITGTAEVASGNRSTDEEMCARVRRQLDVVPYGAKPDQLPDIVRIVMRNMGRRGGFARVSKGFAKMDPVKRQAAAQKGLAHRWGKPVKQKASAEESE